MPKEPKKRAKKTKEPKIRTQKPQQSKKKKEAKKQYQLLQISAALALVAGILVAIVGVLGSVRFSNIEDVWKMAGRQGEGFPLPTTYASLQQAALVGKSLALLGPTTLKIHAPNSYAATNAPQLYHAPALRAANGRLLLFDRDSGQFTLRSKTKVLSDEIVMEHDIFCMDLSDNGAFAAGTKAESAASEIYAYDAKQTKRFAWRCEKEYPSAMRLNARGRGLAVCLVGTEKAEVYTRFMEFDFDQKEPRIDLRLDGAWLYGLSEISGGWLAVGDQAAYLIKRGAQPQIHSYEGRTLDGYDANGSYCAVLLQDWDNRSLLRVYKQGELVLEQGFRQQPQGVQCRGGTVYLQFAERLVRWNSRSGFRQSTELPSGTQEVFVTGGQAYVLTLRNVEQMRLRWSDAEANLF